MYTFFTEIQKESYIPSGADHAMAWQTGNYWGTT